MAVRGSLAVTVRSTSFGVAIGICHRVYVRSAKRIESLASNRRDHAGFRIARMLPQLYTRGAARKQRRPSYRRTRMCVLCMPNRALCNETCMRPIAFDITPFYAYPPAQARYRTIGNADQEFPARVGLHVERALTGPARTTHWAVAKIQNCSNVAGMTGGNKYDARLASANAVFVPVLRSGAGLASYPARPLSCPSHAFKLGLKLTLAATRRRNLSSISELESFDMVAEVLPC